MYKRIWRNYMRQHLGKIMLAFVFMVIVGLSTGATAYLLEPTLDEIFINKRKDLIWFIMVSYSLVFMVKGTASFIQTILLSKVSLNCVRMMQEEMYESLLISDLQFMHNEGTAKQLSRFTTDVIKLRQGMEQVLTGGKDTFTIIALIGLMFYTNWQLSIAAFIFFPLAIFPIKRIGKRLRKVSKENQQEIAQMTSVLDDSLKNLRQSKAYNQQDYELKRGIKVFDKSLLLFYKAIRTRALSAPILDSLNGITMAIVIGWGGFIIIRGDMSVGAFMTFFAAAGLAYQPVRSLSNLWASVQEAMAAAERIFYIIDTKPEISDKPDAEILTSHDGNVSINNVSFAYNKGEEQILTNLNIEASSGQTVALVGPSGAGKSTVLNLIPRFYDVSKGSVSIDGHDIRDVTLHSLRDKLGLVSQETGLFNDTIRANILYGRPDAPEDDVIRAAKSASAHDFILDLPDGYDTMVGEMGIKLSGGQRQRISIARAMLKNAPILLLDEATSALDTESERNVQSALETLMKGRTTIVIAHRLSTIINADKIYVMDKGRVIEEGSHQELLALNGLYSNLHSLQKTSDQPSARNEKPEMTKG